MLSIRKSTKEVKRLVPSWNGDGRDNRAIVPITTREYVTNDAAVQALAADPSLFQRAGYLVHVIRMDKARDDGCVHRPANTPEIRDVSPALLRDRLTRYARFQKRDARRKDKNAWVDTHPPDWCVNAVLARGQWDTVRYLTGFTTTPVLRPDGTLLLQPGYDAQTGLLLLSNDNLTISVPDAPTPKQVWQAVTLLLDLLRDFPFANAPLHKSVWLSFLLTALSRHAIDGPAPLTLFDGTHPGAGKSLLCSIACLLVTGEDIPVSVEHKDGAEMRKSLTSTALAGDPFVVIDNVNGTLSSPALNAALTGTVWNERKIGTNEKAKRPLYTTFAATGNNVVLGKEMSRRVLRVYLRSDQANPEDRARSGFKYSNLRQYVKDNRGKLLSAALTILRGYCAAGRPDMRLRSLGSFEAWSDLVRNAIVWADKRLPDPGDSRDEIRRACDPETTNDLPVLLEGIRKLDNKHQGLLVSDIIEQAQYQQSSCKELWDVLKRNWPGKSAAEPINGRALGMKLHHIQDSVIGNMTLKKTNGADSRVARWKVVTTGETAD